MLALDSLVCSGVGEGWVGGCQLATISLGLKGIVVGGNLGPLCGVPGNGVAVMPRPLKNGALKPHPHFLKIVPQLSGHV